MTRLRPRVLVAAQDPGGAQAVAPVARHLVEDGYVELAAAGAGWAGPVFQRWSLPMLPPVDLGAVRPEWSALAEAASRTLAVFPPQLVLLGTSWGPSLEKTLINAARNTGIPSIGVLDSWMHYVERFSGPGPRERLALMPDYVAVMDEMARNEMVALGFAPDRLVVTGQPAFDRLSRPAQDGDPAKVKEDVLARAGAAPGAALVVFVSEPITAVFGPDPLAPAHPGYDERQVLADVAAAVEAIRMKHRRDVVLVVKAHPKDDAAALRAAVAPLPGAAVLQDEEPARLVAAADAVVGMSSILLVEAHLLGRPVVSYQPGLRGRDPFVLTRGGALKRIDRVTDLEAALAAALAGEAPAQGAPGFLLPPGGAAARVAALVYRVLGLENAISTEMKV